MKGRHLVKPNLLASIVCFYIRVPIGGELNPNRAASLKRIPGLPRWQGPGRSAHNLVPLALDGLESHSCRFRLIANAVRKGQNPNCSAADRAEIPRGSSGTGIDGKLVGGSDWFLRTHTGNTEIPCGYSTRNNDTSFLGCVRAQQRRRRPTNA